MTNQVPFDLPWPATKFCLLLAGTTYGNSFLHILPEHLCRDECMHLVAQMVKNPLAMQETLVRLLGWEDLLEKE